MRLVKVSPILICVCSVFAVSRAQDVARPIDAGDLVTLSGNTRSEATQVNDRGEVDPGMPLEHLELQLRRSPEQEQQVEAFIKALHDPASPSFHQWLTALQYGERFGASEDTIATVRTWLESYG